ncbi:MAG: hypothetical protein HY905_23905 [Deltaproteobacteria bacterium]|nr:hypothetical protein [Deltaproteobacteria bacterium]
MNGLTTHDSRIASRGSVIARWALLPALFLSACAAGGDDENPPPRDDGGAEDVIDRGDEAGVDADGDADADDVLDVPDAPEGCGTPACTLGERHCEPPPAVDTQWVECVAGTDGCPAWGPVQSCPSGQFCQEGACVASCSDVCTLGERRCSDADVQECELGSRGCLAWGTPTPCGPGMSCTGAGVCVSCTDECTEGLARCSALEEVLTCERGTSGCLEWVADPPCAMPQFCWEGACVDDCTDVCSAAEMRCFGDDYQVCMRDTGAGCYGWSAPYRCPGGRACVGAGICPSCTDSCGEGEARCMTGTAYEACELNPATGCRIWGARTECGAHQTCEGAGVCTTICTDDCPSDGARECGPGGGPRTCHVGVLGCLEWLAETPCAVVVNGANVCVGGACTLTCDGGFLTCGPTSCRVSCAPWTQQSPVPPYEELWGLEFFGTTAWAAGNAGLVARSGDRGATWRNVGAVPGGVVLGGIEFATAAIGWAVGNGGAIFRSDDAGANWIAQTSGVTANLRGVSFADVTHGWAVGDGGVIVATVDGGTTWTPQTSGVTTNLYAVHFISATTGWAAGASGRILKTANGGSVWLPQTSGSTYDIRSVRFVDANVGWAVGYYYAYRSTNGGTTWAAFMRSAVQYNAVFPASADAAVIVGAGGRVETTTDGGLAWSSRTSGTTANLDALVFFDTLNALAVGQNGTVISSSNGGSTWIDRRGGTADNLRDVAFADATHGWAVGAAGRIVATVDGGANWSAQTSGVTQNLWGVHFADAAHGWAVGESGVIRTTVDGGTTWTAQTSTTAGALYDVHFINDAEGWAVGAYSGTSSVRYTPDGGTTWMAEPTGIPAGIIMYGVWFNASGRGWIVGTSGTSRYTADRGVTWQTPAATGTTQTLWDVRFLDDSNGFAVGAAGTVIVTTDGGAHWALRGTPATGIFYALVFVDASTGYISGAAGAFLKTIDGGASWTSHPAPTSRDLRGLFFLDADNGWAAGDFGTVLMTRSGGE